MTSLGSMMTSLLYKRGTGPSLHYVCLGIVSAVGTDGMPPTHSNIIVMAGGLVQKQKKRKCLSALICIYTVYNSSCSF